MSSTDEIGEFVEENSEMVARVLAFGDEESRAYALALVANSGKPSRIDVIEEQLQRIRREMES